MGIHTSFRHQLNNISPAAPHEGNGQERLPQFEIYTLGETGDHSSLPDHRGRQHQDRFTILWIKKGDGAIQSGNRSYAVRENIIYYISPWQLYRHIEGDRPLEGYYISFSTELHLLISARQEDGNRPGDTKEQLMQFFPVHRTSRLELEMIARKMQSEFHNNFTRKTELLAGLLSIFLICSFRTREEKAGHEFLTTDNLLCEKFIALVKRHYIQHKLVVFYASELNVTPNYLNRIIRRLTGYTASHHIRQQVIGEAKKQALYFGRSMKEIAYHLGFDSQAHFSKFFKNNYGINFTSFKRGLPAPFTKLEV